jgi:DNA-binding XRE family transcriptional regulator
MERQPNFQLNNLWIARKQAGLGQKSVARRLGHKTASTISEYETGRLLPSLPTALKLAAVYHCPVTELYPELWRQIQAEVETVRT